MLGAPAGGPPPRFMFGAPDGCPPPRWPPGPPPRLTLGAPPPPRGPPPPRLASGAPPRERSPSRPRRPSCAKVEKLDNATANATSVANTRVFMMNRQSIVGQKGTSDRDAIHHRCKWRTQWRRVADKNGFKADSPFECRYLPTTLPAARHHFVGAIPEIAQLPGFSGLIRPAARPRRSWPAAIANPLREIRSTEPAEKPPRLTGKRELRRKEQVKPPRLGLR